MLLGVLAWWLCTSFSLLHENTFLNVKLQDYVYKLPSKKVTLICTVKNIFVGRYGGARL